MTGYALFSANVAQPFGSGGLDVYAAGIKRQQFSQPGSHCRSVGCQFRHLGNHRDINVYWLQPFLLCQNQNLPQQLATVLTGECRIRIRKMLANIATTDTTQHGIADRV